MVNVNTPICQLSARTTCLFTPSPEPDSKRLFPLAFSPLPSLSFYPLQSSLSELLHLASRPWKMPEVAAKSPKTPRRLKIGGEPLLFLPRLHPLLSTARASTSTPQLLLPTTSPRASLNSALHQTARSLLISGTRPLTRPRASSCPASRLQEALQCPALHLASPAHHRRLT
jgi:hypothetical protein